MNILFAGNGIEMFAINIKLSMQQPQRLQKLWRIAECFDREAIDARGSRRPLRRKFIFQTELSATPDRPTSDLNTAKN
jgi:hypothetical protein